MMATPFTHEAAGRSRISGRCGRSTCLIERGVYSSKVVMPAEFATVEV